MKPDHIAIILAALAGFAVAIHALPLLLDRYANKRGAPPPYPVPLEIQEMHRRLTIADLHADSLLWKRNLLRRHSYGHIDLPRLIEGNVAFQVLAAATRIPFGTNFEHTAADTPDLITALAVLQGWPSSTWGSLLRRALYQAEKLARLAAGSQGRLLLIRTADDLDELLARRRAEPKLVGTLLALEGAHALEGDLDNLDVLYSAGFRMIGLTHFFDNEAGGSAHGAEKGGLTLFGRELVRRIQQKRMALDLAHGSARLIDDVLEMTTAPVFVSHTGLRGICDNPRNLSDDQVRRIAQTGGVIGIALFAQAVCGNTVDDTARAIRYGVDLVGVEHLAVGSDFDGTITAPMDVSGMALLSMALLHQGFAEAEIAQIMGGNVLRVLRQILPKDQDTCNQR